MPRANCAFGVQNALEKHCISRRFRLKKKLINNITISNGMIVESIFKVFRKDRSELTSNKGRGGGVIKATKQNMD